MKFTKKYNAKRLLKNKNKLIFVINKYYIIKINTPTFPLMLG
jgi:hypothetical protein